MKQETTIGDQWQECPRSLAWDRLQIGSRDSGDEEWDNDWLDICTDISAYFYWIDHPDDSDDSDNFEYEEGVIIGPFGEEEYWSD